MPDDKHPRNTSGTEATGGATGGSAYEGADTDDRTVGRSADRNTDSGDIPGVADEAVDLRAEAEEAEGSDVATTRGLEPGRTQARSGDSPPHPGYVSDHDLQTPGQVDSSEADNDRMGAGNIRDLGIDSDMREEMLDNAVKWGLDDQPTNVNDERGFDDGLPGSWSDFSPVASETSPMENTTPEGAARFADPNDDAGGETKGPRVEGAGAGGFDGGPPRDHPLPGDKE